MSKPTKKQRAEVWAKSNGHCWYCGNQLPEKGWHVDHVEAVIRNVRYVWNKEKQCYDTIQTGKMSYEVRHTIDNMVPACPPCNLYKSTYSLEEFRHLIQSSPERYRKQNSGIRAAERFGMIEFTEKPVVFWFEQQGLSGKGEQGG